MKLPRSLKKLEQSLDEQITLLAYYLDDHEIGHKKLSEYRQNNNKIKELLEHAALDRKISHARFLNKLRGLGFVVETEFTFLQRLKIAFLFLFRRLDPDKAVVVPQDNANENNEVE